MYTIQNTIDQILIITILWPIAYRILKKFLGLPTGYTLYFSLSVSFWAAIAIAQDYNNPDLVGILLPYVLFLLLVLLIFIFKKLMEYAAADFEAKSQNTKGTEPNTQNNEVNEKN
jgi:hypothetical protein